MESPQEARRKRLASEPALAEVARGVLRAPTTLAVTGVEPFAKEMRALLGFEQLPDPVAHWTAALPTGELVLRRTLAVGKLELRRWEGELTLFRRPVGDLKRILDRILARPLLEVIERAAIDDGEVVEWRCSGPFESLLAVREGRSVLLRLSPRLQGETWPLAHERADDVVMERMRERTRPPSPWAIPAPLAMPAGGRFPKRAPVRKKRVKR